MDNTAYLEFMTYANEKIQQATQSIVQFGDDINLLEMQREQLELLFSMFNQLTSHISENHENFPTISTYMRDIQVLLNQYIEILSQLDTESFVNINLFISKGIINLGK